MLFYGLVDLFLHLINTHFALLLNFIQPSMVVITLFGWSWWTFTMRWTLFIFVVSKLDFIIDWKCRLFYINFYVVLFRHLNWVIYNQRFFAFSWNMVKTILIMINFVWALISTHLSISDLLLPTSNLSCWFFIFVLFFYFLEKLLKWFWFRLVFIVLIKSKYFNITFLNKVFKENIFFNKAFFHSDIVTVFNQLFTWVMILWIFLFLVVFLVGWIIFFAFFQNIHVFFLWCWISDPL